MIIFPKYLTFPSLPPRSNTPMFLWFLQLLFNVVLYISAACVGIANLWPVYCSALSLTSNDEKERTRWFAYWIVMAPLMALELSPVTGMIPGYASFKLILIFWLIMPKFQGAELLYSNVISPLLTQFEEDIDSGLQTVRDNINSSAAQISQKGMEHLRQHSVSILLKSQSFLAKQAESAPAPALAPVAAAAPPVASFAEAPAVAVACE